nr:hypothetical protein [Sulfuriferula sp. AH1]
MQHYLLTFLALLREKAGNTKELVQIQLTQLAGQIANGNGGDLDFHYTLAVGLDLLRFMPNAAFNQGHSSRGIA